MTPSLPTSHGVGEELADFGVAVGGDGADWGFSSFE